MKVLNFGSLNYDYVYEVDHFVKPKETLSSKSYVRGFGGKGLNQSIALNKAGIDVYHAGRVGYDGDDFLDYLAEYNVNTTYLYEDGSTSTGHAIIEVCNGENRIITKKNNSINIFLIKIIWLESNVNYILNTLKIIKIKQMKKHIIKIK